MNSIHTFKLVSYTNTEWPKPNGLALPGNSTCSTHKCRTFVDLASTQPFCWTNAFGDCVECGRLLISVDFSVWTVCWRHPMLSARPYYFAPLRVCVSLCATKIETISPRTRCEWFSVRAALLTSVHTVFLVRRSVVYNQDVSTHFMEYYHLTFRVDGTY